MEIQIMMKNVYGKELIYPANEAARLFCKLTAKRTFDINDLRTIKALGYSIVHVFEGDFEFEVQS